MTLFELGQQYLEQERILRKKIAKLRTESDPNDITIRRRLYYLTMEAADCKCIGNYLSNYYNREDESDVKEVLYF